MFGKVKKNTKKQLEREEEKRLQAIEDAKSDEQKAYEKMQADNREAALAYAREAMGKLASMGWQWLPMIQIPNRGQPNLAIANLAVVDISWDLWKRRSEAEKKANEEKAAKEAAGEGSDAGVEAPVAAPDAPESTMAEGTAETAS